LDVRRVAWLASGISLMQLTLVLPNVLDIEPDLLAAVEVPALTRLLSGMTPLVGPEGIVAYACTALGIAKQDDWPVAPWLALAAGIEPGGRYWLCAEPLTFELDRDQGRLAGIVGDLDTAESAALLSSLRAHFQPDGVQFVERGPGRWWMSTEAAQQIQTSPPNTALGRPIVSCLPRGADAARWRRWQSEMQMLLYEHPVNQSRERDGRSLVNYIWAWGGGTLHDRNAEGCPAEVFTDAPLLRELSRAIGCEEKKLPASFDAFPASPPTAPALVWFDDLNRHTAAEQLAAFDVHWAAPLERALDKHEVSATLVIAGSEKALCFAPGATGAMGRLRRRWSTGPSLRELLSGYAGG
jgi:hypothetical protein